MKRHRNRYSTRPAKACPGALPRCITCGVLPWRTGRAVSCVAHDVRGRPRLPVSWDGLEDVDPDSPCQCGAQAGGLHHWPCDVEICPWAEEHPDDGEQLLCCGCMA